MSQVKTDSPWASFRVLLELENRSQQIESAIAHLKGTLAEPETMSIPDTVAVAEELRWHLDHSLRQVAQLEKCIGIQRRNQKVLKQPKSRAATYSLRGSTRSVSVPDLIGVLSAQRKTGSLWIKGRKERFILELLDGAVVHAMSDSPRPDQRLGTVLVAHGKLSTDKLEEVLAKHDRRDGKIGEILSRAKLVSEDDLRNALEWQVKELFHRISGLEEAVFCFREGAISKLELRVCMNTTQLLLESAQAYDERAWEEDEESETRDTTAADDAEDTESRNDETTETPAKRKRWGLKKNKKAD